MIKCLISDQILDTGSGKAYLQILSGDEPETVLNVLGSTHADVMRSIVAIGVIKSMSK